MVTIISAQELTVRSFELKPMDMSASVYPRNDKKGRPCALVKVVTPLKGMEFEGNVLGDVENKSGEYWVYMSVGTIYLRIKHSDFVAEMINFMDYGIKSLDSKVTYELVVVGNTLGEDGRPAFIDLETKILRNDGQEEELLFKNGDDLYLSFLSPVNGYLTVYLVDEQKQAYCLLPYSGQITGNYPIAGNQDYLFFNSKKADDKERSFVDEYVMTCSSGTVDNQIYIIFSPYQFFKASDHEWNRTSSLAGTVGLPRQLSEDELKEWLSECQQRDKYMNVITKRITISN